MKSYSLKENQQLAISFDSNNQADSQTSCYFYLSIYYYLINFRYVSLKFLAWYFLEATIQGVTHDSIEDAVTSLR